jgi:zinc transport system substrate-binding protein
MRKLLIFFLLAFLLPTPFSSAKTASGEKPVKVFVSVLPLKYFVDRVGGDAVEVSVMVGPGRSPQTYEPTPRQMAELSRTQIYYRVGVPFEQVWIKRIADLNPHMRIVDLRKGIPLLYSPAHGHGEEGDHHEVKDQTGAAARKEMDPHIWTNPRLVKIMAAHIRDTLAILAPDRKEEFAANYEAFAADLDRLDRYIRDRLKGVKHRKFLVFHPAWGYFAEAYGLQQVAIEAEGKEPGPRALAQIIDLARKDNIRTIFVQPQFSRTTAETVARAINGRVVAVDPLAEDYMENMRKAADAFVQSLE